MRKIFFFLTTWIIIVFSFGQDVYEWQSKTISIWSATIMDMGYSFESFQKEYPHFPSIVDSKNDANFLESVYFWKKENPDEFQNFIDSEGYQRFNFSLITLGLQTEKELENKFSNGWWEYINGSGISQERLLGLAPHFPFPNLHALDLMIESKNYEASFSRWTRVFPNEYNNLVNAEELVSLNPYYEGGNIIAEMPSYIKGLQSSEKPEIQDYVEKVDFEDDLMAWFIVYDFENFEKEFGFSPFFPKNFDLARHRTQIARNVAFLEKEVKK